MKVLILTVLCFGCAFAAALEKRHRGGPPTFSCEGKDDGFYADHHRNCQVYYMCKGDEQEMYHCESGERFSEEIWACMPEDFVECPVPVEKRNRGGPSDFSCDGHENGFYADHSRNCQVYYMCKDGTQEDRHCESGERFNEKIWACMPEDQVECPAPVAKRFRGGPPVFSCEGRKDGYYPDLFRKCHMYYRCEAGQAQTFSCSAGTLFDTSVNACVREETTTCPTEFKRELYNRVKAIKTMDDRLVKDLELLLRRIQKNRK